MEIFWMLTVLECQQERNFMLIFCLPFYPMYPKKKFLYWSPLYDILSNNRRIWNHQSLCLLNYFHYALFFSWRKEIIYFCHPHSMTIHILTDSGEWRKNISYHPVTRALICRRQGHGFAVSTILAFKPPEANMGNRSEEHAQVLKCLRQNGMY